VLGAEIQRLLDPLIGALECGAVVYPRRIAKQQQGITTLAASIDRKLRSAA
jgi:hypothetical protein